MSALVPYNYGGFSSRIQFGSHKQRKNRHYDKRFMAQQLFIPRPFPTQPYYPPSFYPTSGYLTTGYNQFGRSNRTTDLISLNQLNRRNPYARYRRYMDNMQKNYWKQEASTMPLPRYTESLPSFYNNEIVYQYEKETRYVPYPVFLGEGHPAGLNTTATIGGTMNLAPKIRVIFVPTGFSSLQQSCAGPMSMPPFLFNRMSQPLCSLPLPPPLPQIESLPLTPFVQQMIMQQYANPVAVLPFTPNWQMSQPTMSGYSQFSQQQQQSIMPISALQTPQSPLESYIPPTLLPANVPMLSSNISPSLPFSDSTYSQPQYTNSSYPNICRACPPAPPSLNIPVTGHQWMQHCSACHHVPAGITNPNIRPTDGRFTPLLRRPTVLQNLYNPIMKQQQQYPHVNASVTMRPWLHQMPPLPAGAVIISDGYINKQDLGKAYYYSQKYSIQHPRVLNSVLRSISISTANTNKNKKNKKRSGREKNTKHKDYYESGPGSKSNSVTSLSYSGISNRCDSSTSSTCSLCNTSATSEQQTSDISSYNNQQNLARQKLSAAAHHINLRYKYQSPDLLSVYHNNHYLKPSDTDSTSLSTFSVAPSILIAKEYNQDSSPPPPSIHLSLMEEEDEKEEKEKSEQQEDKKSIDTLSPAPFQLEKPVKRIIIIRQFITSSPSTISTASSDLSFIIAAKDFDSISTTSTIRANQIDKNAAIISEPI